MRQASIAGVVVLFGASLVAVRVWAGVVFEAALLDERVVFAAGLVLSSVALLWTAAEVRQVGHLVAAMMGLALAELLGVRQPALRAVIDLVGSVSVGLLFFCFTQQTRVGLRHAGHLAVVVTILDGGPRLWRAVATMSGPPAAPVHDDTVLQVCDAAVVLVFLTVFLVASLRRDARGGTRWVFAALLVGQFPFVALPVATTQFPALAEPLLQLAYASTAATPVLFLLALSSTDLVPTRESGQLAVAYFVLLLGAHASADAWVGLLLPPQTPADEVRSWSVGIACVLTGTTAFFAWPLLQHRFAIPQLRATRVVDALATAHSPSSMEAMFVHVSVATFHMRSAALYRAKEATATRLHQAPAAACFPDSIHLHDDRPAEFSGCLWLNLNDDLHLVMRGPGELGAGATASMERQVPQLFQWWMGSVQQASDDALARASHDLKQPIEAMRLIAELMRLPNADVAQLTHMLETAAKRMRGTVQDALERGRKTPWCLADAVLRDLSSSHALLAAEQGVQLELHHDENALLQADPRTLGRLLSNLVGNAVQAAPSGSTVHVELSSKDGVAHFKVHNAGAWGAGPPGDGLGLGIAHALAGELGATLAVHVAPHGCQASVTLRCVQVSEAQEEPVDDAARRQLPLH